MSASQKEEVTIDAKVDLLVELLNKMQKNMTRLETESAEVRSLLNDKNASEKDIGENQKPNPNGNTTDETNANLIDEEEDKIMVDQEAMDLMEKLYSAETETEIDEATGEPVRVVIEDHVDFATNGFPIAIKEEMMLKKSKNQVHNGKVNKVKVLAAKQMAVKDN